MIGGRIRNVVLALTDALCIGLVWSFVVWGYKAVGLGHHYDVEFYLRMWPVIPAFLMVNLMFRLYHGRFWYPSAPLPPVEEMRRLVGSSIIVHSGVLVALVLSFQTTQGYSRFIVVASGLLTAILSPLFRDLARTVMFKVGIGQIKVVVVGSRATVTSALAALSDDRHTGFCPVGLFLEDGHAIGSLPCLGGLRDVVTVSRRMGVRILVSCEEPRVFATQIRDFASWFLYIEYMPTAEAFPIHGARAFSCGGMGGLEMVNQGRMQFLRLEKWILDKTLSIVAFVFLLPVMVAIAATVKLTSRGPIFYGHPRLGRNGKKFQCWKFRTMYLDANARLEKILAENPAAALEWKSNFKLRNDPRVTAFGRFLRKTSLDEIPQFFNVFMGDMALVGPRPIVEGEVCRYGKSYGVFSSVKPGITGLWQVSGRSDTDYTRRVALDVEYVLNWSPWMDLWIIFRTGIAVVTLRGAC